MIKIIKKIVPSRLKTNIKSFINFLIPKKKNQVLFYSIPDFSDNAKAVYDEMIKNNLQSKYKLIWIVNDVKKIEGVTTNSKVIKIKTLRSFINFCRSKYIFTTHSFHDYKIKRQVSYQLWHGNGLKVVKMAKTSKGSLPDYVSVSADIFKVKWPSYIIKEDRVLVTGLPRNDELFNKVDLKNQLNLKVDYKKTLLWMPTFRTSNSGIKDGINNEYAIPLMSDDALYKLNNILKELNVLLLIKTHSYSHCEKKIPNLSNILPITDEIFTRGFTLYNLIGNVDLLLTDYSSVYVDYLLLDKPIGFVYNDLEQYANTRGFIVENPKDYMPGEHINSFESLVSFLKDISNNIDRYKEIRKDTMSQLNKFSDNKNSKRILQALKFLN